MNYIEKNLIGGEKVELRTHLHWINFVNLLTPLTFGIAPYIQYKYTEYALTNKRVIMKWGFINTETFEMNLSKIETINVEQSLMGKIFGWGDITIIGTGGTRKKFDNIENPLEFRKKFVELTL